MGNLVSVITSTCEKGVYQTYENLLITDKVRYDILFKSAPILLNLAKIPINIIMNDPATLDVMVKCKLDMSKYEHVFCILLDRVNTGGNIKYRYFHNNKKYMTVKLIHRHILSILEDLGSQFSDRFRNTGKFKEDYDRNVVKLAQKAPDEFPN